MKLVVLCPYPPHRAPSQRLKFEQYYDSWRAAGFDVDVRPFWDESGWSVLYRPGLRIRKMAALSRGLSRRLLDTCRCLRADVVYVHLEAIPVGPPILERFLAWRSVPIVYDIDDLTFLRHSSSNNPFMRWVRSGKKYGRLMTLAAEVIVCTDYLEEYGRQFSSRITNISSTIDTDVYQPREPRSTTQNVVVGWSGSHSTAPYLHLLDDLLCTLQRTDGIELRVIGDSQFEIPGARVEASEWALETEVDDLCTFDIGLYPLPDDEWVLGKSGLKALQYMALGIATIAQRTPVNETIIEHGVNGYLATDAASWRATLEQLIREPGLRTVVAGPARRTVEERYSVTANAARYLAILQRAAGLSRRPPDREPHS